MSAEFGVYRTSGDTVVQIETDEALIEVKPDRQELQRLAIKLEGMFDHLGDGEK